MRKYKLFGKIPIFDLIIVLLVVVVAIFGIKLVKSSKSGVSYTTAETKEVFITIKFSNVSEQIEFVPKTGDKMIEATTNNALGVVESFEKENHTVYDYNDKGELITTTYDDRFNYIVKIKSTATMSEIETLINGTRIGLGKNITCSMPAFSGSGTIIDIKEVSK